MKISAGVLVIVSALLFSGCNHALPQSSIADLSMVSKDPELHAGELISDFGRVLSVQDVAESTVYQITTPNYMFSFVVTFPGDIPGLQEGDDAYFLGRVTGGVQFSSKAFTGFMSTVNAIAVDAIAVKPIGGQKGHPFSSPKAVYRPDERELARAWLRNDLELSGQDATRRTRMSAPETAAAEQEPAVAPRPAIASAYPPPQPAAPAAMAGDSANYERLLDIWSRTSAEDRYKFFLYIANQGKAPAPGR